MADDVRVPNEIWDPKAALESLMFESQMDGGDSAAATARLLREHALLAAQSIAHLSAYGETERVRLEASRYIVDKVLASGIDADIKLHQEQVRIVGNTLASAVRVLSRRFNFDPESEEVRTITRDTLLAIAAGVEDE